VEVRLTPAESSTGSSSLSYVRLQAGLVRETVPIPDSVELGAAAAAAHLLHADHALLAFIRDAAETFVDRRVSQSVSQSKFISLNSTKLFSS